METRSSRDRFTTSDDEDDSFPTYYNSLSVKNSTRGIKHRSGRQKCCGAMAILGTTCGFIFFSMICSLVVFFLVLVEHRADAIHSSSDARSRRLFQYSAMSQQESDIPFRLPKAVKPLLYDLYLHPDLEKGTFQGKVSILINVAEKQRNIILHQKDLNISSVILGLHNQANDHSIEIKESHTVEEKEVFVITPKKELENGVYNLTLTFAGSLQNKIVGFYSSRYRDEHNKTRLIATSKFEPTYARRSFPCFDEPGFKAEFSIKIVRPSGDCYNSLSNMNLKNSAADEPAPGLTTDTFAKSVPMSTYLACFIVSDFVAVTKKANGLDGRTFPVSVYTTRAKKEKGQFALDFGVKVVEYYINLFKVDYPLPKLDMAAIPDFVSGAMENWGLVTYREARLLVDDNSTSVANKEDTASVVAHEFAHMWFGNLVTMAWWNDLWLNEGFATYMSFKSTHEIIPEWNYMDQFLLTELHPAFNTDAKLSSHPIIQTVNNPDEITAIFDVISYQKGASIIRMLENFVGSDNFWLAISKYLKKFAYENARTPDLLDIMQSVGVNSINIPAVMDTWTRQMGYPVINVKRHKSSFTLTQKRFLANPHAKYDPSESEFGYKWTIPVTYITSANSTPSLIWFDKDASNVTIKLDEPVDWIKFNSDQVGYYRVNYEKDEWEAIINVLRWSHKRLSSQDRTHIVEDAFSLADAGELGFDTAMNITLYLGGEKHYSPWYVANNKLRNIDTLLSSTATSSKFRDYVRELVDGTFHDVTWNVDGLEGNDLRHLRIAVIKLACAVGHVECMNEVGEIFKTWINDKTDKRPHPDIRTFVYYYGMNHVGSEADWDIMFKRFVDENNAAEKVKLMNGLAGIRSAFVLKKYISLAMDENYVRSQDALTCLGSISNNPDGTHLVWDWVRENWPLLVQRYTLNDRYLGRLIPTISQSFSTKVKLDEMQAFFNQYKQAGAGATYRAQALETVETNIKWLEKNEAKISNWLDSRPAFRHVSK
ncbi:hypothetical protein QAD02_010954 [Eretmocerus hayati]|uniref:Uncharacterized protein n=1 Tax=Eretmocerus hayati TaxID=131215 RepID=A0ACC2NWC7_9HYME|nr:hypothetical protein QAD02_010954 [Eretmocerus hayati]